MTAYRQDALRCLTSLKKGPQTLAEIRMKTGVSRASSILQKDHYGWFERVSRGKYQLSPGGIQAVLDYQDAIANLA